MEFRLSLVKVIHNSTKYSFIKIKRNPSQKNQIMPKQRDINLTDPKLKKKGIKKKYKGNFILQTARNKQNFHIHEINLNRDYILQL